MFLFFTSDIYFHFELFWRKKKMRWHFYSIFVFFFFFLFVWQLFTLRKCVENFPFFYSSSFAIYTHLYCFEIVVIHEHIIDEGTLTVNKNKKKVFFQYFIFLFVFHWVLCVQMGNCYAALHYILWWIDQYICPRK